MDNRNKNQPAENVVSLLEIENQLERGGLFTHTLLSNYAERINNLESYLYGMADALLDKGTIEKDDIGQSATRVQQELVAKGEQLHPGLALRVDDQVEQEFSAVNCEERLPVCKAICCKLDFALSAEEVESGKIKWALGKPYFIRHKTNGYCSHLNEDKNCCSIYEDRPPVCKQFSCANDERIWKDFDNMVINQEWIDECTGKKRLFLEAVKMDYIPARE